MIFYRLYAFVFIWIRFSIHTNSISQLTYGGAWKGFLRLPRNTERQGRHPRGQFFLF
jgi:hypothetical protein